MLTQEDGLDKEEVNPPSINDDVDDKKEEDRLLSRSCGSLSFHVKGTHTNMKSQKQLSFRDNELDPREISSIGDNQKGPFSNGSNNALLLDKDNGQLDNFKEID